ncbi:MAG: NADH:ubiquinone reductase (Na(+)-transporting) subunit E, partial [Candidatus Cloacimonetes bacterium]|nr:NADH:ubiquinone reductase (Na(+)-transporting) subunit E [Candidatus Cloacimonadota bacterium]
VNTAIGLGFAVIFVMAITTPVNWIVHEYLLKAGALSWLSPKFNTVDLSFLNYIAFIATIAAMVQIAEMAIEKISMKLYVALGIFLPLITVNCAILGVSLFMIERKYTLGQSTVFGISSGVGWMLAIISMAAIREKLKYSNIPKPLRGLGITMLLTGLIAMAFMTFSGIDI